jgi:hypothetical protein
MKADPTLRLIEEWTGHRKPPGRSGRLVAALIVSAGLLAVITYASNR